MHDHSYVDCCNGVVKCRKYTQEDVGGGRGKRAGPLFSVKAASDCGICLRNPRTGLFVLSKKFLLAPLRLAGTSLRAISEEQGGEAIKYTHAHKAGEKNGDLRKNGKKE